VIGAALLGASLLLAAACAALAWTHVRRVLGVIGADVGVLTIALKRTPAAERLSGMLARTAPGSWEHELAEGALAAPDEDARVRAANLALADLEHDLLRTAGWPRAGLRIGLLGHAFLALSAYLVDRTQPQRIAAILVVGALTALACVDARRRGDRAASQQRRAVDALLAVAFSQGLPPADPGVGAGARQAGEQQGRWLGGVLALPDEDLPRPRRSERRARRRRGIS
jgi:hypothetical protein